MKAKLMWLALMTARAHFKFASANQETNRIQSRLLLSDQVFKGRPPTMARKKHNCLRALYAAFEARQFVDHISRPAMVNVVLFAPNVRHNAGIQYVPLHEEVQTECLPYIESIVDDWAKTKIHRRQIGIMSDGQSAQFYYETTRRTIISHLWRDERTAISAPGSLLPITTLIQGDPTGGEPATLPPVAEPEEYSQDTAARGYALKECDLSQDIKVKQGDKYTIRFLKQPISDFWYSTHETLVPNFIDASIYSHQYIDIETHDTRNDACSLTFGLKGDRANNKQTAEFVAPDFAQSLCAHIFATNGKRAELVNCIGKQIEMDSGGNPVLRGTVVTSSMSSSSDGAHDAVHRLNADQLRIVNWFLQTAEKQRHETSTGRIRYERRMKLPMTAFSLRRHIYRATDTVIQEEQLKVNCILFARMFHQFPEQTRRWFVPLHDDES